MADKILNAFDVWITAKGLKTLTRLRSVDNISLEGIGRLRELIFELAIRGQLIPQDNSDEPAEILIKRIGEEKKKLVEEGKLKKQQIEQKFDNNETPFIIPKGWKWTNLGVISNVFNGNSISSSEKEAKYTNRPGRPFIATKDVGYGWDKLDYDNGVNIPNDERDFRVAKKGTVLICAEGGSAGKKCGVTERDICFGNKLFATELFGEIDENYVLTFYQSPSFYNSFKDKMTGIIGGISISKFIQINIPLPPLNEQRKIASKVLELMALCDALEHQETHHLKSHQLLIETLLGTLTRAADANEFQEAWNKLYEHFDDLFTTEDSIDQLKQTILQLAVMGKLVPQNPNDEPASELLKKIAKEKERLVEEGKIKRQKQPLEIKKHEMSFEIPKDWSWCRLNDIVRFSGGGTPSMSRNEYWGGEIPWISPKDMSDKYVSNSEMKITKEGVENSTAKMIPRGSLLVVARSGILKRRLPVAINMVDCTANQDIKVLIPYNPEINKYLLLMFSGLEKFILENYVKIGTTVHSLKYESFEIMSVPIPPIKEQHRIIAKVDKLFALCDRLKGRIGEAQKVANQIAEGVMEIDS